ncbi:MAG: hypothetical protein LBL82_01170 [Oscillospiraceae bacterium]|jgi:hypothetical protein|nr:hypothetical protein [Oscillospiraceae bacterium]
MFSHIIQDDYIVVNGSEYPIINVSLIKECSDEGNIIGTSIAKSLKFDTDADIDFENLEFEYFSGFGSLTEYEYIRIGTFIVVDFSEDEQTGIKTVSALDTMLRFNIPYVSELNYADGDITINDVIDECCEKCGVSLKDGQTITNGSFVVDGNQFEEDALFRNVIQAIAQISGSFAQIENDELVFSLTGTLNAPVIDSTNYEKLNWKRSTWPINTVVIGKSQIEGENVTLTDNSIEQHIIAINDNPFAYSQEKREELIEALYEKLYGFEYVSYELINCVTNPAIPLGTPIVIITPEGESIYSYVFSMEYSSPEGCSSAMSAPSITRSAVNYQFIAPEREILRRTEVLIDKANSQISAVVEDLQQNVSSEIEVTTDRILSIVHEGYATNAEMEDLGNMYETAISHFNNQIEFKFSTLIENERIIEDTIAENQELLEEYIRFQGALIELGRVGNSFTALLSNEKLSFLQNNTEIAYISNNKMYITDAEIKNVLTIGNSNKGYYDWVVKSNGNLSLKRRTT